MKRTNHSASFHNAPFAWIMHERVTEVGGTPTDYRVIDVNSSFVNLMKITAGELLGSTTGELQRMARDFQFDWFGALGQVSEKNTCATIEYYYAAQRQWFNVYVYDEGDNLLSSIFMDITPEKAGERLYDNVLNREKLLDETPAVVYSFRLKDGLPDIHYISGEVKRVLGFEPEVFINNFEFWKSAIHPDDLAKLTDKLENGDKPFVPGHQGYIEYRFKDSEGHYKWIADRYKAGLSESGDIEIFGVWLDVTVEKQKSEELRQYKQRLSLALGFARSGSWEYDLHSGVLYWSKECEALFGLDEGSFEGTFDGFINRVHPNDRDYVMGINKPIVELKEGLHLDYEHRIIHSSGSVMWVKETAGVLYDENGKPQRIIGLIADVTIEKLASEAIENETRLQQIVNNIDGVFWLRSADRFEMLYVSPSIESLFGVSQRELYDNPNAFTDAVHHDDKAKVGKALAAFLKTGVFNEEYRIVKPDGELRWMASRAFPVKNETGETIRFAGIVNDITNLKENEIAVKEHAQKLNALIEAMPDMIFIMHRDGTILEIYGADSEKLIAPPGELIGRSILGCFDRQEAQRHLKIYGECIEEKKNGIIEFELVIQGRRLLFESRIQPLDEERLLTIVRDITNQKEMAGALNDELAYRKFLFESDRNGLVILDNDHKVTDMNSRFCEMTGYKPEELRQMHTWDFDDNHSENEVRDGFDFDRGIDTTFESRHRRKDGSTYEVEVSARSFTWRGESFVYCSCLDISERIVAAKRLEESERKYRQLIGSINDVLFTLDDKGTITYISPVVKTFSGYEAETYIGAHFSVFVHPEHLEEISTEFEHLKRGVSFPSEYRINTISGEDVWVRSHTKAVINETGQTEYGGIAQNITASRKAALELKESEEKYRMLFDANKDSISIFYLSEDGQPSEFIEMNETGAGITGYDKEDLLKMKVSDIEVPSTPDEVAAKIKTLKEKGEASFESQLRKKDGELIDIEVKAVLITYNQRPALLNITRDITARKKAANELRTTVERLRLANLATNDVIWDWDVIRDTQQWNEAGTTVFGWTEIVEHPVNAHWWVERVHPDDRQRIHDSFFDVVNNPNLNMWADEYFFLKTDNTYAYVMDRGYVLRDSHGNAIRMIGAMQDITQRKQAEKDLKDYEIRTNQLLKQTRTTLFEIDPEGLYTYLSPSVYEMSGYTVDELKDKKHFFELVPEDQRQEMKRQSFEVMRQKQNFDNYISPIVTKNGAKQWILTSASPVTNELGDIICYRGSSTIITEQYMAEEKLRASEERWRSLIETSPDGMAVIDFEGNTQFVSERFANMYGYSDPSELLGRNAFEFIHPDYHQLAKQGIEETIRGLDTGAQEFAIITKSGDIVFCEINAAIIKDKAGNPESVFLVHRDISDRRAADEAIRKSEEKYRVVAENTISWEFWESPERQFLYNSPSCEKITGLKAENLIKNYRLFLDMIHPDDIGTYMNHLHDTAHQQQFRQLNFRIINAQGEIRHIEHQCLPVFGFDGSYLGIRGSNVDITERIKTEEMVRQSRALLNASQQLAHVGGWEWDVERETMTWTDETYHIHKIDPLTTIPGSPELIHMSLNCYDPDDRQVIEAAFLRCAKEGIAYDLEFPMTQTDGNRIWIRIMGEAVTNGNRIIKVIGTIMDITGRRQAEEAILHGKQRLESFLEISRGITSTLDQEEIMQMVVDNAIRIMGLGSGAIYLQNDEETIRLEATSPALTDDFTDVFRIASLKDHPHIANTFATGHYQVLADSTSAELSPAEREIVNLRGLRTNLYLPIRLREKMIGVLILSSVGETCDFSDEEIDLLQGFANEAAHIIDNISNFAELKKYADELEKQISQRKEAEEVIKQNEERFRQVAETNQTVIWELDDSGIYTYVSPMAEKIWGYKPGDLVGKVSYFDLHPEEGRQAFIEETMRFVKEVGSFRDFLNPVQKPDGSIIWVSSNGRPVLDEYGTIVGFRGSDQDVTDRINAEKELRKFKTISDQANYGTAITDLEGTIIYVNDHFAKMHGWEPNELTGKNLTVFHHEKQLAQVADLLAVLRSKGNFAAQELDHIRKDGSVFPTLMNASIIYDDNGKPMFMATTAIDITEIKAARLELLKLTQAVVQNPAGITISNVNGIIEYVNPRLCQISGYQAEELIGQPESVFNSGYHTNEVFADLWTTIMRGDLWKGELLNKKKNGELYWENVSISPIRDIEGKIINFVAIKEDITHIKQLLVDLKIAKENAEESNRLKTAFINNISHEIRTPLNGIIGFGELVLEENLTRAEKQDYYKVLKESSDRLQQTITDIMDISELRAGSIVAHPEPVKIMEMMEELQEFTSHACASRNVLVACDTPPGLEDLTVITDHELLKKAMTQLLNNASKFTREGRITFGYELSGTRLGLYVTDTGVGIPSDKQDVIFEPFMQADISNTRGHEGSGLGLAIVKGIVDLMKGEISLSSQPGRGSEFRIELPVETVSAETSPPVTHLPETNAAMIPVILIAEDNESNYLYIKLVLQKFGYTTLQARDGAEAVDMCRRFPEISLILMDIKMPVLNGVEATRQIRAFKPDIPVIATTAYAQTGDRHRFIAEGFNDYLAKPIRPEEILALVGQYIYR